MLCNLYKFKMYIDLNATPLIITNNYWLESMPIWLILGTVAQYHP